jgi:arginine exporter protein ArgO
MKLRHHVEWVFLLCVAIMGLLARIQNETPTTTPPRWLNAVVAIVLLTIAADLIQAVYGISRKTPKR